MLLTTKLIPPQQSDFVVPRPRLFERLDRGAQGRCTFVSGPAGYGKTTLIANWLLTKGSEKGGSIASTWLALDEYDNEPIRFMRYFVAALQRVHPELTLPLDEILQSEGGAVAGRLIEELMTLLINELALYGAPFLLVIDDIHHLTDPQIVAGLSLWMEHGPASAHTVLIGRDGGKLPIGRWRAGQRYVEIVASELGFTAEEAAAFLKTMLRIDLTEAEIVGLNRRTEGWIAGLQLAALSLQATDNRAKTLRQLAGTDRHIMDYLIVEVLEKQPPDVTRFLLQTSILERLTPALCNAVTASERGSYHLSELETRNLFVVPLDNHRAAYRYHPLFADALQTYLKRQANRVDFDGETLHRRAFEWFKREGLDEEGVPHALAAGLYAAAADCLDRIAPRLIWEENRARAYYKWCQQLPESELYARPQLATHFGWALLQTGRLRKLAQHIEVIDQSQHAPAAGASRPEFDPIDLGILKAEVAVNGGLIEDAIGILSQIDDAEIDFKHRAMEIIAKQLLGYAHRLQGDIDPAKRALFAAIGLAEQYNNRSLWLYAHADLAETYVMAGELRAAEGVFQSIFIRYPQEQYGRFKNLAYTYANWGRLQLLRNRLPEALEALQHAQTLASSRGWLMCYLLLLQAEIGQLQGNWSGVERLIERSVASRQQRTVPRLAAQLDMQIARLQLLQGEAELAGHRIRSALGLTEQLPHHLNHRIAVTHARYLMLVQDETALDRLNELRAAAAAAGWGESLVEIDVLLTLTYLTAGDQAAALDSLASGLTQAAPDEMMIPFLREGGTLLPLLRQLGQRPALRQFVGQLQAAFLPAVLPESSPLVEPLTKRELDVLKMVATGLSNPEIAEQLIVATGTVAKHTNNIFGKLGVRNRTEATQKARELGLLDG